jgi:hypothetical protein
MWHFETLLRQECDYSRHTSRPKNGETPCAQHNHFGAAVAMLIMPILQGQPDSKAEWGITMSHPALRGFSALASRRVGPLKLSG